jgi:hypothetical protein
MDECQLKGLFYNCEEKYFSGNKIKEQIFFMDISKDVVEEYVTVPLFKEPSLLNVTLEPDDPLISLHALTSFSAS